VKRSGVADIQPDFTYRGAIGNAPNGALTARFKEAVNINQVRSGRQRVGACSWRGRAHSCA